MEKQKINKRPIKHAIIAFVLSFTVVLLLLTVQFLWKYSEDIFYKNINYSVILEITLLAMRNIIVLALPVSILVTTTVYYRHLFKNGEERINIKGGLLYSIFISLFCFLWIAFITPANNLRFYGLLFDIRSKFPDKPLQRTDANLFTGARATSNYFQLGEQIDSLTAIPDKTMENIMVSEFNGEITNTRINILRTERMKMIGFPFMAFILFYLGMFLGVLNRHNKLIFLLIGIFFIVIPGIYFLSFYFENFVKSGTVSPLFGQLFYLLIIAGFTSAIYFYAKKQLMTNNKG